MSRFRAFFLVGIGLALAGLWATAADPESRRVTATRTKMLPAKLNLDIDKKMLRFILESDLPAAVKEATKLELKILPAPGQGVTLTSSFELKGEMTLEEALNKICEDKSWGWYVNIGKEGDQKDGAIFITTNPKERGFKDKGETAKKDDPKSKPKSKGKEEPKTTDGEKAASDLYTKAKFLVNTKQTEKARPILTEIIEKYPDTKAATRAKDLLESIGK